MKAREDRGIRAALRMPEWILVLCLFAIATAPRFINWCGPLDEPVWRQVWCTYQAHTLSQDGLGEFPRVKINFKGTNDLSIWNYPLYEGVIAAGYTLAGGEVLWVARLITLALYLVSLLYLYRSVSLLFGIRVAMLSAACYYVLPLGIFYSRAVHYDILVLLFSHMLLFYGLRYFRDARVRDYTTAVLAGVAAFLIKPPYVFFLGLPILVYGWSRAPRADALRVLLKALGLFVLPLLSAWIFNEYRLAMERNPVSSLVNPDPYTRAYAADWFFGALDQRLDPRRWWYLVKQATVLVGTPLMWMGAIWVFTRLPQAGKRQGWLTLAAWVGGCLCYILLVFPMVASAHDYYLLPFLAPASAVLGVFFGELFESAERDGGWLWIRPYVLATAIVIFAAWSLVRGPYFSRDWHFAAAGSVIAGNTAPHELVAISAVGRSASPTDPRQLYFARRRGWACSASQVSDASLEDYREAGARWFALIRSREAQREGLDLSPLSRWPHRSLAITGPDGAPGGDVLLYDLSGPRSMQENP